MFRYCESVPFDLSLRVIVVCPNRDKSTVEGNTLLLGMKQPDRNIILDAINFDADGAVDVICKLEDAQDCVAIGYAILRGRGLLNNDSLVFARAQLPDVQPVESIIAATNFLFI